MFNETLSDMCECPKACDEVHYKTSMSYTSVNQNHENRFDLSETFLKKAGKNLNESLDTKERILPDRRRANIEEAERVIRELPQATKYTAYSRRRYYWFPNLLRNDVTTESRGVYTFISMGLDTMQEVLQRDFIAVWNSMHPYDCMSDSFELTQIVNNSANVIEEKPWRAAVQLRLVEKLIASKRASYNLDRVHDAYCNAALLVNNMATPNGSYDSLYLTETLFRKTTEINQTYTRLGRHIKKYMVNIDGLLRSYIADGHVAELILNFNRILEVSFEYERDMKLYESLFIRQPLQRVIYENNKFKEIKKIHFDSKIDLYNDLSNYDRNNVFTVGINLYRYDHTRASYTISSYLENLKNKTTVSKLSLAAVFTSDKILKLVDIYQESVTRSQDNIRKLFTVLNETKKGMCLPYSYQFTSALLDQWITKQNDHYNRSSDYEKAAMERYFMPTIDSSIYRRLLRRDRNLTWDCSNTFEGLIQSYKFTTLSLRQLIAYKNKLDSLLRKSRLDGTLFRYVSVV